MKEKRELLRTLVTLAIPTILEEILSTLLQYVDTAMVGRLGESATASVSVTTTITWLLHSIPSALGISVLALTARALGSGDEERIRRLSMQVLFWVLVCGSVLCAGSLVLSPYIPVWMGAEESIQAMASRYFFVVNIPMVFRVGSMLFGAAIRATKDTRTPMFISLGANGLNAALNYILIYSMEMGVMGAALASAIAYTLSGIFMYLAYRRNRYLHFSYRDFHLDIPLLRECASLSIPVLATSITSCMGYVVFASLVTGMGNTVFAAHSIAVTAETIFYIPGYGLRTATSTLVGISLGERDRRKFENVSMLSVVVTVGMMCMSGLLLYRISNPLMTLFSTSRAVVELGAQMLRLVAFSEPFFGLMIVLEGIFYGLGRTKYAFVIETGSMWFIRIFFTFLCVRVWHRDLQAVWYCMIMDNVCKAILFALPFLSKRQREKWFAVER